MKEKKNTRKQPPRFKKNPRRNEMVIRALLIAASAFAVMMLAWLLINESKTDLEKDGFDDRGVPVMNLELNGVSLIDIQINSKEEKYRGNNLYLYNNGEKTKYGGVEIKGRGNTTWFQEKRPYRIELSGSKDLLGSGKAKRWVLLANYFDHSFLRTDVAFRMAEMLDMSDKRGDFVELYFDGEYEGLYYLMKKIEVSKSSINLKNANGVLFEIDTLHNYEVECNVSYIGDCLVLKDIVLDEENNKGEAIKSFLDSFNRFEMAVEKGDYNTIAETVDIDSFINYFLINEFTVNPDAYNSSFYLYRDGENDKIHFGPLWDFDYSLGNKEWFWREDDDYLLPDRDYANTNVVFRIVKELVMMDEIKEKVSSVFQEKLAGRKVELVNYIETKAKELEKAARADNLRWNNDDYFDDVNELIEWVERRYDYFEQKYGNPNQQMINNL